MKHIIIKAKERVFSSKTGVFAASKGEGFDFEELVEYDYQSDAKKIDWLSYAKSGQLYQKRFRSEHARNILILPILTGSLFFGYHRLLFEKVVEASAILAYSALLHRDRAFLGWIEQDVLDIEPIVDLARTQKRLEKLAQRPIVGLDFSFDFSSLMHRPKSLVILLGDLLYEPALSLLASKHEVVLIIFRQRLLPYTKRIETIDNVTFDERSTTLSRSTITRYTSTRDRLHERLLIQCKKSRIDTLIIEDEPIFERLKLFFGRR